MGSEIDWLTPQSEYRPTKYVQGWLSWWWDDAKRLTVAKKLQMARLNFLQMVWQRDKDFKSYDVVKAHYPAIQRGWPVIIKPSKIWCISLVWRVEALRNSQTFIC